MSDEILPKSPDTGSVIDPVSNLPAAAQEMYYELKAQDFNLGQPGMETGDAQTSTPTLLPTESGVQMVEQNRRRGCFGEIVYRFTHPRSLFR